MTEQQAATGVTVGDYAGVVLEGPDDQWWHGAIFLLHKAPRYTETVSLDGWTTTVLAGERAVITRGPSTAETFSEILTYATEIANRGLDYMSVTGRADCAIREAADDCLVWWRDPATGDVSMRFRIVPTFPVDLRLTMQVTVTDPNGVVQPSPPPSTPVLHDAFRFIRMSRTADDLYDSYRNLFLGFECLLSDIRPPRRRKLVPSAQNAPWESETDLFQAALAAAETLAPLTELTPDNVANHKRWIFENMYQEQRCALMHAKQGRSNDYLLPQGQVDRRKLIESLGKLSRYMQTLIAAHLDVHPVQGTFMSAYMKSEIAKGVLREYIAVLSDDPQPLSRSGRNLISDEATTIELTNTGPAVEDSGSPGSWTSRAICDIPDLRQLNGIRKVGLKPLNGQEPPEATSELVGPLHIGSAVKSLEVEYGNHITNRSEPPSAFTS